MPADTVLGGDVEWIKSNMTNGDGGLFFKDYPPRSRQEYGAREVKS